MSVTKSRRPNLYAAGLIAASLLVCGPNTATGQVDLAIDNAVAWLLENQNPNGSFGDAETLKARDSAASVLALLDSGYNSSELTNGLIFVSGVPDASVQFRAQRTQALAHAGQSVAEALDSLLELQNGSGYGAFSAHESNLFDTVLAIQALSLEEQARLLEILPLLDYLLLYQNPDGGWGFVDGAESNTYFTAEAVLALAVLETLEIAPEVLAGAVDYLVTQQLPDGGFGSNLETALVYRALLALGYDITALPVSPVINLLAGQAPDGSWEQDLFTTSNAVLALSRELPNLTITDLQATPGNVTKGDAVTVEVTVANVGPSASPPSYLALRAGAPDGTDEREELTIVGLAPGESIARSAEMATDQDEGELMLFAVADSRGDIEEISENDNDKRIRIGILTEPDLALFPSDVSPSPALPAPNTDFSLLVNVRNLGETTVTSFPFRISRLVDGSPVEVLAEGLGGPASPGTGALVSGTLNLQEGEHLVLVELDPENVVAESAEDNNIVEARIVVFEENLPDLAISEADLIVTPPQPSPGETVSIEITVRNQGVAEATATLAVFDGAPEGGGAEIYSTSLTIAPSGAQTVSTSYLVGPETSLVTAVIDAAELIVEIDEGNNRARRILVDRPDLSIGVDNLELVPTDPLEGDPVQVVLTVRNAGTAEATDVPIEVFEGEPGLGGTSVFSEEVPFISPGGNRVLSFSWSAARGLTTMVVVADPNDLIEEFSETNNRVDREVAASRSTGPDLVVAELDLAGFDQSPLSLVATGILTVDVLNQGDEEIANSFGVRVFEDRNGDGRFSSGDQELASSVVAGPLGIGESLAAQLDIDAVLAFHRPLIWVEADHTGAVDEAREDNNRRAVFGSCEIPTQPSLEVVEEWYLPGVEVESTPVVAQLSDDNGDGLVDSRDYPDVAFHTEDDGGSAITARSGIDGSELWTFRSSADHPLATRVAHLAAADLDGNGISEIIGVQSNSRLIALDHKGAVHWVSDTIESTAGDLWAGGIAVGDLSGDGVPEVAVGRSVLSNTGALIAVGTGNAGRNYNFYGPFGVPFLIDAPLSVIADVDLDGQAELVAGDTLYRLVNDSLTIVWDKVEPDDLMVDGYVAVANLDSDPKGEIVYVSSNRIMVLNHDGSVLRPDRNIVPFSPFTDPTFWGGPPTVAELDGTAPPEILVSAYRELVAFRSDLSVLWRKPTSDQSEQSAAAGFDFDGDGSAEVLYADETHFYILEGATGDTLYSTPNLSKTATEYPVVADVDGDGRAEILVPSNRAFDGDDSTQGLHVLGNPTWSKTRPVWNQHSYHVTNVQLDGTVPESEVPSWSVLNSFRANQSLAADVQRLPNLTLGAPRTGPATAEGIPVTVRVGNGGLSLVPPGVELQLFEGDPGASPPVGLAETSSPLAPGAWEDVEINWQAPGSGPRPATAVVDPSDSYQECDEGDNTVAFEVDEQLLSDLTIPAGGVSLGVEPTAGQLIPIDIEVGNIGSAVASQVVVTLFDGEPLLGKPLGTTIIDLVNVGESAFAEIMWDSLGFTGLHMIHAASDPDDLILELNETNNEGLVSVALEPPTKPDLAVESFEVVPNPTSAGQLVLLTSDVANRGLDLDGGFDVVFRLNHAEVGRVLVPDRFEAGASRRVELQLATSGLTGVYVVEVELDPDYLLDEENETNNLATEVLQIGSSDLSLVVTTDRPNYGANDIVAVGANGISSATAERAATLVVSILDSFDSEVALLTEESVDLQPGENTFSFVWDTGAMPPGAYQAVGQLRDGEVLLAAGTALFSIGADVGVVASLLADRETYLPTQSAILTASVRNTSANNNLVDLGLQVSVRDPGGQLIFGSEEDIQLLPAGDIRSVDFTFFIDNEPPGSYTAVLAVSDSGGQTLTTAGSQLVVEDSADTGAGLRGSLNGFPDLVGRGGPIQVDLELTNAGNTHLPNLEVRLDVMRLADGALASFLQFPAPLDLGETLNRSVGLSTNDLDEGDYLINLVGLLDGVEKDLDGAPITVARGVSVADEEIQEGDSGTAAIEFTATLSSPSDVPVTVEFATADGTALAGVDYQETIGPLSFPPGVTAMSFTVPVFGDLDGELDETFQLILQNASGAQIADGNAIGTIRDEEGCPSPNLIVNGDAEESDFENPTAGWSEVDSAGWRQRFSAPSALSGLASFTFGGLDAAAELQQPIDLGAYAALTDTGAQEFAFSAFLSSSAESPPDTGRVIIEFLDASKLVVLDFFDSGDITSDSGWTAVSANVFAPTGTRWAVVRLLATRGAGDVADVYFDRISLVSLGAPGLSITDPAVVEGDTGSVVASFGLQLTCPATGAVEIDFQTGDGTAEGGNDYLPSSGTVHLDPGETSGVIEVEVLGDSIDEEDEDFLVTITAANGVVVLDEEGKARILDDDGEPVLSISDGAAVEGDWDSTDLEFVVLLSPPSGKVVTVDYATAAGTALPDDDFLTASGTLTFAPGVSAQSVPVSIAGDKVNELEEKFSLILSQSNNATIADGEALGTIIDNDEVEITVDDVSVVEGDEGTTDAVFNVHLSVASDRPVSLDYATADGEAVAPDDYLSQVGLLTFPPQATTSTVAVPVVGEILIEALETFRLVLSNPSVGVLVDDLGIARILDNDAIQIRIEDTAVIEGDDGSIQADLEVSLSRASSQVLTVDYQTNDGSAVAGEDYLAVSDTLIFAPGATSQIVSIPLLGDAIDEPIESFLVVLTGPSEGVIFDAEGEATILDDDGWHLNGSATIETIPACIQLTPTISQQKGSAWRTTLHDLTENFDQTYRVYLGNKDSSGADGIVFTLQNVGPEAIGTGTGNSTALGYWGLAPSVGVELDTWESSSNLDQIAVNENGQMNHSGHPPVPASADSSNIEDGQEHDLRLVWSAASQTLAAYFDESRRLFYSRDIVTDIFGGGPQVFYGFTGGTGGLSNLQYFCPTDLCFGTSENPSISIGDAMAIEGDPNASQAVFPVTLSCPSEQPVHASFATEDGTAVAGEDYLPVSGVMTFLPGETSKSVVVEVVDDPDSEPNEDFSVEISDAIGGDLRYSLATGTIESEDVTARLANTILVEGDLPVQRARLTVELTEPVAETLTLQYASTDGSAIAGSDYDSVSGDLVFSAGQTTKLITIDIRGDLLTEGDEELFIQFSSLEVSSFVDSQIAVTLLDDDDCPSLNLLANGSADDPPVSGGIAGWTVIDGSWYASTGGTLEGARKFTPGMYYAVSQLQQDVDVSGYSELIDSGLQRFEFTGFVRSYNQSPADASRVILEWRDAPEGVVLGSFDTGEIANRSGVWHRVEDVRVPPAGTRSIRVRLRSRKYNGAANDGYYDALMLRALEAPSILVRDISVVEGSSGVRDANFDVALSCPSPQQVTVNYLTSDGTAVAGVDYAPKLGTLIFEPGETLASIPVQVYGDTLTEGDETFYLDFLDPSNAAVSSPRAEATIIDDEISVSVGDVTVAEGDAGSAVSASFLVELSAPIDQTVTLDFSTEADTATAGTDFEATFGTLIFQAGEDTKSIVVQVLGDLESEPDETFLVNLTNASNVAISDGQGLGRILDDDISISISDATQIERDEGSLSLDFLVSLSGSGSQTATVDFATVETTATEGSDYAAAAGTLSFSPGQTTRTISIPIYGDTEIEPSETFAVRLNHPTNAHVEDGEATGVIIDDDDCPTPNLIVNGSAEEPLVNNEIPGWAETISSDWRASQNNSAFDGQYEFYPGISSVAELEQDVDVSGFGHLIDSGLQRIVFTGYVRSGGNPPDVPRIIVEYWNEANDTVLEVFDSGEIVSNNSWKQVGDFRLVPVGTRWVRVRLRARRQSGSGNDAKFDALSLRFLGVPGATINSHRVLEGDAGTVDLDFDIRLHCAPQKAETLEYVTLEDTATAGSDFEAASGTLTFDPEETLHTVTLSVFGDVEDEPTERFFLALLNPSRIGLLDSHGEVTILDDDGGLAHAGGPYAAQEGIPFALDASASQPLPGGTVVSYEWDLDDDGQFDDATGMAPSWSYADDGAFLVAVRVTDDRGESDVAWSVVTVDNLAATLDAGADLSSIEGSLVEVSASFVDLGILDTHTATVDWGDGSVDSVNVVEANGSGSLTASHIYRDNEVFSAEVCVMDNGGATGCDVAAITVANAPPEVQDDPDIDLRLWTVEHYDHITNQNRALWNVAADGKSVIQVINARPSVFYGGFPAFGTRIRGTIRVDTNLDNDYIGIALGYQPGDNLSTEADFLLLDWKQANETGASRGMALSRVTGPTPAAWGHATSDSLQEIARAINLGYTGWQDYTDYEFIFEFDHNSLRVFVNGSLEFDLEGVFQNGRLAFYNYSQERVRYNAFTVEPLVVDEGEKVDLLAHFIDVGTLDTHTATIDWQDGTVDPGAIGDFGSATYVIGGHAYLDNGSYPAEVCVTDDDGGLDCGVYPITVNNVAPVVDAGEDTVAAMGVPFDLTPALFVDPGELDTHAATIDWGDGTLEPGVVSGSGGAGTVTGTHVFLTQEAFNVEVCVTDDDGASACDSLVVTVTGAPSLTAAKVDSLAADLDGNGVVSPGDEVLYQITVTSDGTVDVTGIELTDPVPVNSAVIAGSVQTTQGTVLNENPVQVSVGGLTPGTSATVSFRVSIDNPFPAALEAISNQGSLSSNELPDILTDDPDAPGTGDPTVTVVIAAPDLTATKSDLLAVDADGDGGPSPGDVLEYRITVANSGNTWATSVTLLDPIPLHATVVPGSVQSTQGTVASETPVQVSLGGIPVGGSAVVSFRVRIDSPFPFDVVSVVNQATISSNELPPVLSDDPETLESGDPTSTPVSITPDIAIADVSLTEAEAEAGGMIFAVTLSAAANREVAVDFATSDGTALSGADYQATFGTLTLAAGETTGSVVVQGIDDALDELDETFLVTLSGPVNAIVTDSEATGTLLDDDAPPALTIDDISVIEGDAGTTDAVLTVSLDGPSSQDVSVDFTTIDVTAQSGSDYQATNGSVSIPAGEITATIGMSVFGDTSDEPDETFSVQLSNPVHVSLLDAQGTVTILDDDQVEISIGDAAVIEGDSGTTPMIFSVTLSGPSTATIAVDYETLPGSAVAGEDYVSGTGILTIPAGETQASLTVLILGDSLLEEYETIVLELSNPSSGTLIDSQAVGTILDDEICLGPNLLVNPGAEEPMGNGELPGWIEELGTDWQPRFADPDPAEGDAYFFAGAAEVAELRQDIDLAAYEAYILAGNQVFLFEGLVRTLDESPEDSARIVLEYWDTGKTVLLDSYDSAELTDPTQWRLLVDQRTVPAETGWAKVRLITTRYGLEGDADGYFDALSLRSVRTPVLSVADQVVTEGDAGAVPMLVDLTLSCAVDRDVTVDVATTDGTAIAGEDYIAVSGATVTVPAANDGATITIQVLGDILEEDDEYFSIEIGSPLNAVVVNPQGTGLILNDDGPYFCPRSPGYWKNHSEAWPLTELTVGGVLYGPGELMTFLEYGGPDASMKLARQLVATKLNLASGSDPDIQLVVDEADAFLVDYPPGSNPNGQAKQEALRIKDDLEAYNEISCGDSGIQGLVWFDTDGDGDREAGEAGIAGAVVDLYDEGGDPVTSGVTAADGTFGFSNLGAGFFLLSLDSSTLPAGTTTPTFDFDGADTPHTAWLELGEGEITSDADFGYTGTGTIGDRVWNDHDGDGLQDAGEPGLEGIPVTLLDSGSIVLATTTTGSDGTYLFGNLPVGSYTLLVDSSGIPADWEPTFDSDGVTTPDEATLLLGAGESNLTIDFGYHGDLCSAGLVATTPLFGVHDGSGNTSQFFKLYELTGQVTPIGPPYKSMDVEAMDFDPFTGLLYAIAGGRGGDAAGDLFAVGTADGSLTFIGNTGASTTSNEIQAASFHPDGTLWVHQENIGLHTVDLISAQLTLQADHDTGSVEDDWEGMAWDAAGEFLYGSQGRRLYRWDPDNLEVEICDNLPGDVEALELDPEGRLYGGKHGASNTLRIFEIVLPPTLGDDCIILENRFSIDYNDVESISWGSELECLEP